jgi:hypothetical protein
VKKPFFLVLSFAGFSFPVARHFAQTQLVLGLPRRADSTKASFKRKNIILPRDFGCPFAVAC